jgi:hypothetical protein
LCSFSSKLPELNSTTGSEFLAFRPMWGLSQE